MCQFNYYYNGSECIACPDGFYGYNCSTKCARLQYGRFCSSTCDCPKEQCNFATGCPSGHTSSSSQLSSKSYKKSVSTSVTTDLRDHTTLPITTGDVLSTSPPQLTPSNNPINTTNILIITIGGLIALFLFVIVTQWFVKLYLRRKERTKRISIKTETGPEEEVYEAINDSVLTEGAIKHTKYYELKNPNALSTVPYQELKNNSQYQEIDEKCIANSSTSSNSDNSSMSYLEPKSSVTVPHKYIELMECSTENTLTECSFGDSFNQNDNELSMQYINPIHDVGTPESESNSNNAYLDVTNETTL